MFRNFKYSLVNNYSYLKNSSVFIVLFLTSLIIRFPFFFRDYIDRDESTFILMGQSWVDGNLPYTQLWDLKPPIVFLFFAAIIYTFGKSFLAIRFFGVIIVALTSFFTYQIGKNVHSKKIGLFAAVGCVLCLSLFGSLQGVMSEHICMLFFVPALYLITRYEKLWAYCCSGFLFGLAVMSKLNIAYVIFILCSYILYLSYKEKRFQKGILHLTGLSLSLILAILWTLLPYYLEGQTNIWWSSVIMAPIEYSVSHQNPIYKTFPFYIIIIAFLVFTRERNLLNYYSTPIAILTATILGELLMFIIGGKINGHYLIQFYPIFIILFFIAISQIDLFKSRKLTKFLPILLFILPIESYLESFNVVKHRLEQGTFYNGEGIDTPNYILKNNIETKNILFLEYHIGYWVLEEVPPTVAATHPSNILRESLFPYHENPRETGLEEIEYIMETIKPPTVVTRKNRNVFDKKHIMANEYINNYLKNYYKLNATVGRANIYQRLK